MHELLHRYRVIIPYREPTFETHRDLQQKKPYRAEYFVTESSPEEAEISAIVQFHDDAKHAHVGWIRIPDYSGIKVEMIQEYKYKKDI